LAGNRKIKEFVLIEDHCFCIGSTWVQKSTKCNNL